MTTATVAADVNNNLADVPEGFGAMATATAAIDVCNNAAVCSDGPAAMATTKAAVDVCNNVFFWFLQMFPRLWHQQQQQLT